MVAAGITLSFLIGALQENLYPAPIYIIIAIAVFLVLKNSQNYNVYTKKGRNEQDHIDGLKMYIKTTELERMKIIGTPPTENPKLYEQYLPYAIALDVEKEWTNKFAPIFKKYEEAKGSTYRPHWYYGRHFSRHSFSSEFSSHIMKVGSPPGRYSGSGGRGSSGGGGGGGGGGGW